MSSVKLRPLQIYANVMSDISKHEANLQSSDAKRPRESGAATDEVGINNIYLSLL